MDDAARAVLDRVDRQELIDLASALIRIPSFKTEETAVARWLDGFFRGRGYAVDLQEIEPGRLQTVATLRGTGGAPGPCPTAPPTSTRSPGAGDVTRGHRRWKAIGSMATACRT